MDRHASPRPPEILPSPEALVWIRVKVESASPPHRPPPSPRIVGVPHWRAHTGMRSTARSHPVLLDVDAGDLRAVDKLVRGLRRCPRAAADLADHVLEVRPRLHSTAQHAVTTTVPHACNISAVLVLRGRSRRGGKRRRKRRYQRGVPTAHPSHRRQLAQNSTLIVQPADTTVSVDLGLCCMRLRWCGLPLCRCPFSTHTSTARGVVWRK